MTKSKRKPLRIVSESVVCRKDPTKVLGSNPEDFPELANRCKAAIATMTTGVVHVVKQESA